MGYVLTSNPNDTFGARPASARPEVDGAGYFATFDILYWQAKVDGTEFAYSSINLVQSYPVRGRVFPVEFDWNWGFRAGFGTNFVHGGWDLYANFTYFKSDGNASVSSGTGGQVVPTKGDPQIISTPVSTTLKTVGKATSQYGVDFDRVDLELGKNFYNSYNLSFRPHLGLVTTWINQKQTVRYTAGPLGINTVQVKDKCDFWGMGPRTGLDSKWYLTNGFSVFGNISGALVYGLFQVQHKNWYSATVDNKVFLRGNVHKFAPTAQMQIGLSYDTYLSNERQHLCISLGYDCQYWWSVNQNFTFNSALGYHSYTRENSNLSFHGIDLHLRLDF